MNTAPKLLFISGSVGLGHVTRDLAIAAELRARCPGLRLSWLAGHPAQEVLREAGEEMVPESADYGGETRWVEGIAGPFSLCFTKPWAWLQSSKRVKAMLRFAREQKRNVALFRAVCAREQFDLVIGDEIYDLVMGLIWKPAMKPSPLVLIFDFVGMEVTSRNPLEWVTVQSMNWWGVRLVKRLPRIADLTLLLAEEADVADKPFGLFLPNRRELARAVAKFAGYVCPFNPAEYQDRNRLRQTLGYSPGPLVICSIGGTSIGRPLLELCGRAYPLLKRDLPELQMVLVCGPRLDPDTMDVPEGVQRRGYVDRLFEHLAACDLAVVQGGGTTTLELTALRRPFLYFSLEGHFEQRRHVADRLKRHGAGIQLEHADTSAERLAALIQENIGRTVDYPPVAVDGASRAAELILQQVSR